MPLTRRELIKTGVAGMAVLGLAACSTRRTSVTSHDGDDDTYHYRILDLQGREIVAAVASVMLAGALPGQAALREPALRVAVRGFDTAVAGLPPSVQSEVHQLFGLLQFPLTRWLAAGITVSWAQVPDDAVAAFLTKWRYSSVQLFRSGYDALHQLIMAGWYGDERTWPAMGYPGPPRLGVGG